MSFPESKASLSNNESIYDPVLSVIFVGVAMNVGTGSTLISSQMSRGMTDACLTLTFNVMEPTQEIFNLELN